MGFRVALLAYFDEPESLDLRCAVDNGAAASRLVGRLFPRTAYGEVGTVSLLEGGFPSKGALNVGVFDGGELIATRHAHLYNPTKD